jgi:hypothetical protein
MIIKYLKTNEYFGGKRNEASGTLWTDTEPSIKTKNIHE